MLCLGCADSMPISASAVGDWLDSTCFTPFKAGGNHEINKCSSVRVGNSTSHISHDLRIFRGLVYCNKCGSRGPSKLVELQRPCETPTESGLSNRDHIRNGKLPVGLLQWLDEE